MPLDTGLVVQGMGLAVDAEREEALSLQPPSLESSGDLGSILRAVREFHGLDLEDLSQLTRIRRNYLLSIEEMNLDQLPSRPFTLGYIRAYAAALGLDGDAAVARFKQDAPDEDEPLRAPVGVPRENDPRLLLIAVGGAIVIVGVALWNVAQHAVLSDAGSEAKVVAIAPASTMAKAGPSSAMSLGAPPPVPQDSTTPKPYVTPGLEVGAVASSADPNVAALASPTPTTFMPKGTVYGAAADPQAVILQAKRAASVVIHGADGSVYFARELAAGEAYRAPPIRGLSVDVSDPAAFDVFVAGAFKGALPAPKLPIAQLLQ